jgi:RimJ/RimL family protein N-acetyltransferase
MSDRLRPLIIPTDNPDLYLRELILADAPEYFAVIDANRQHLNQYDEGIADKYPTEASVRQSILYPNSADRLRTGIWNDGTFVGSANLTPVSPDSVALGYWLDGRQTGKGYVTVAARALAYYGLERYRVVEASTHRDNHSSMAVLGRIGFRQVGKSVDYNHYRLC